MTTVVNIRHDKCDVYVGRGRGSIWGNPFTFKQDTLARFVVPKDEVLTRYSEWVVQQPELMKALPDLRGLKLGCFCRPRDGFKGRVICHAQILAALADGGRPEDVE